jgi:hypothetical protein
VAVIRNAALCELILARPDLFPPVPAEPERVIRCAVENLDRAIARALARAAVWREVWRVGLEH